MDLRQPSFLDQHSGSVDDYYDYIILGAGAAGLSLLMHMIDCGKLADKTILLVDQNIKNANDRTWCFWETHPGLFEQVVYKEWKHVNFYTQDFSKKLQIDPYTYKLIRALDFYNYCFKIIGQHPNIIFKQAAVDNITSNDRETHIIANGKKINAQYIFNSILFQKPKLNSGQHWLLQHFKGWVIETPIPTFTGNSATLMDFRTDQGKGTAFFYVLPFSATTALVEYTLFSPAILSDAEYEEELESYIRTQLNISSFTIHEKEFGCIPMTNFPFPSHDHNIIHIGTAGGQTKGSTGYTFRFIQKHSAAIVNKLISGKSLSDLPIKKRFRFYDGILLGILQHGELQGEQIFKRLFDKNKSSSVLKFLDNETNLGEEISIIRSLPKLPFLKSAIRQLIS